MYKAKLVKAGNVIVYPLFTIAPLSEQNQGAAYFAMRNNASNRGNDDILPSSGQSWQAPGGSSNMAMPMMFQLTDVTIDRITYSNVWRMKNIGGFAISGGEPTVLMPGYAHMMLMNVDSSTFPTDYIELNLTFAVNGPVKVEIPVVASVEEAIENKLI